MTNIKKKSKTVKLTEETLEVIKEYQKQLKGYFETLEKKEHWYLKSFSKKTISPNKLVKYALLDLKPTRLKEFAIKTAKEYTPYSCSLKLSDLQTEKKKKKK